MTPHDSLSSDDELLIAISRSDATALEEVYRRHAGTVFGLALRVLRDSAAAEEVVQDVFVRLWKSPDRFDSARGTLRSFLCTQAHSRAVDLIRSENARRRRQDTHALRDASAARDVETTVANVLIAEQVRRAIDQLPERERRAIELAYLQGLTYVEVAQYLEEPEGTIKSRIRSGLRTLHGALARVGVVTEEVSQ